MKIDEIRGLAPDDLSKLEAESREELFKLRYSMVTESVESSAKVRTLRKQIARIKTVQRQHELSRQAEGK